MTPLTVFLGLFWAGWAQMGSFDSPRPRPKQYVMYASESQVVAAGRPAVLELRFRVLDGYHVNSHRPGSELLMPTAVSVTSEPGVRVAAAEYSPGTTYVPAFAPSERLDVYTGEFSVRLPVEATAGAHELRGELRYQACDGAACYPGRTLPLDVLFSAR